ncbi:MAG: TonB-dependent receptor plug domain-containing protein [Saprospiraceae bacterium]
MKGTNYLLKIAGFILFSMMIYACSSSKNGMSQTSQNDNENQESRSTTNADDNQMVNVLSFMDQLRKTAGIIVKGSAENPEILIRGFNTLSAGTEPLLVIDGSIYNGTITDADSFINGNQIKRIKVLKEPGEVGIYGVRGGNGVIEVTLK